MKTYSQRQFSKIVGVSRDTLINWDKSGKLSPMEKCGERKASRYTEEQIEIAKQIPRRGQKTSPVEPSPSLFDESNPADATANSEDDEPDVFTLDESNDAGNRDAQLESAKEEVDAEITAPESPAADVDAPPAIEQSGQSTAIVEVLPADVPIVETPPFIGDMAVPLEEKTLQELAGESRLCFERGDDYFKQGAMYYIEGGRRLIEAKRRLKHGQWQNWLSENFSFSQDTATNRMKLAERFGESKSETFRNLKPATLIKLLALPAGDEQAFLDAQEAAGRPVQSQSARELQRNVKAWKEEQTTETQSAQLDAKNEQAESISESKLPPVNDEPKELNSINPASESDNISPSFQGQGGSVATVDDSGLFKIDTGNSRVVSLNVIGDDDETSSLLPDENPFDDSAELKELRGKIYAELNSIRACVETTADVITLKQILSALATAERIRHEGARQD